VGVLAAPLCVAEQAVTKFSFVKGYSWGFDSRRGAYESPEAARSMKALAATGTDTVCLCFSTTMRTHQTPEFAWGEANPRMVSDEEIRNAMDLARENRMKVILKPMINCRDGVWRSWVKFYRPVTDAERAVGVVGQWDPYDDPKQRLEGMVTDGVAWNTWWRCYREFIVHYARIAEEKHAEAYCLGCEMGSTQEFEDQWRRLIREVRGVYHGPLTYDVNHGDEENVAWWDALDYISISAYYPVEPQEGTSEREAVKRTTSKEEIAAELRRVKGRLAALSRKRQRPICFLEVGCPNIRGCARYPWASPPDPAKDPTDDQEQVNYYTAMFETFNDEPWFMGYAWWDWPARLETRERYQHGRGFCVYGRAAEKVMRAWYAKQRGATEAAR
jgi:hypothetical protein